MLCDICIHFSIFFLKTSPLFLTALKCLPLSPEGLSGTTSLPTKIGVGCAYTLHWLCCCKASPFCRIALKPLKCTFSWIVPVMLLLTSIDKWNILLCYRLRKYWLKGEKAGTSEVIAILPGYPDNVRANERNEFWVAIHCRRTIYSYINGIYPRLRQFLLKLPISAKLQYLIHIGGRFTAVVVKYSPEGKLLQILEDRQGKVVRAVSEVEERDGKLWMGSVLMSFISVYQLEWTLELLLLLLLWLWLIINYFSIGK